jgi:metallo-beta-lactamase family protein
LAELTFLGAARTVTGSKYLLDTGTARLLVDCGLFQGLKELRERNWAPFPVPPESIDAVVLTHAHLDHVGLLPRLVAQGYGGLVFCTPGTADLARIVLPDSARIQQEDARLANKHAYTKHSPALPLYTETDTTRALGRLQPRPYHQPFEAIPGVTAEFAPAGHLLGSAFVGVTLDDGGRILFGGDLGRYNRPVLTDPSDAMAADVAVVESTYGDRDHLPDDEGERLAGIVRETAVRRGKLIIPAFAIGRVEELLYWLRRLEREQRIPTLPVYVDSPMATEALKFYMAHVAELDPDMKPQQREVSSFATARFQTITSPQQSKELTASRRSAIVISSSGMAAGGRVLHHLAAALPDPRHTVLFVGYQAVGTRGRALVEGSPEIRIHGRVVPVRARVTKIDSMSAHADRGEMLRWLATFPSPPRHLYLVHGEPGPMDALKSTIERRLQWTVSTPAHGERIVI